MLGNLPVILNNKLQRVETSYGFFKREKSCFMFSFEGSRSPDNLI